MILEDPLLTSDVEKGIAKDLVNAEFAIQSALERISHTFEVLSDEYFRERKNDILEVGDKILRHLLGKSERKLTDLQEDSVVVAHNLLPSDTASINTKLIRGFAIDVGGKTSHTALLAQSLEIPAVVGLKDITGQVRSGQTVIIDGNQGLVILDPDKMAVENYRREQEIQVRETQELIKLRNLPAQTLDEKRVELSANIETADEVKAVQAYGGEGIGLFRTEYLFINRTTLPTEDEQYEQYARAAKQMMPYTTLFRTMDVGGDKLAPFIDGYAHESNPFLGLRALRFCLKYPQIFRTQLRALLRASVEGKIRIMFPMVIDAREFLKGKEILEDVRRELLAERVPVAPRIEIGAMIEVPSAALTADLLAREADFLSIGTNDLIQYTLAVDRVNENVASLYEPLHLSILRLVKMTADAAHAHGKWVGMCGEMASDSHFTRLLLGLGIDEFSVAPAFIPKIKKVIRSTHLGEARKLTDEIMNAPDFSAAQERLNKIKLSLA
jgi:phosphotransferase system enzyme I (PtsI)